MSRLLSLSFGVLLFTSFSSAQNSAYDIIPANLPACALECTTLQNAQTGCIPPAAPITNTGTYQNCFCQSALLTSLKSAPSTNICSTWCDAADWASIDTWYVGLCGTESDTTAATATTLTTSTTAASTGTGTGTTSTASSSASSDPQTGSGSDGDQALDYNTPSQW